MLKVNVKSATEYENSNSYYQKAIKVRKVCETKEACNSCIYYNNCKKYFYLRFTPLDVNIKDLAKTIKEEKWKVK